MVFFLGYVYRVYLVSGVAACLLMILSLGSVSGPTMIRALCLRGQHWQKASLLQVAPKAARISSYHPPCHQIGVVVGGPLATQRPPRWPVNMVLRETRRGLGFTRRFARGSTRIEDAELSSSNVEVEDVPDPSQLELPPGVDTESYVWSVVCLHDVMEDMTPDEIMALAEGYRLVKASAPKQEAAALEKADLSYLYAASDDPADHHPGHEKFRMGSVYTMTDDEYNKFFPGLTRKHHAPYDSPIHRFVNRRFLMIRPHGVQLIQQLKDFAGDRFPKAAEAEGLWEEWVKSGRTTTGAVKGGSAPEVAGVKAVKEQVAVGHAEDVDAAAPYKEATADLKRAEEEEEDDYDLFGADEDLAEEADRGRRAASAESSTDVKKKDIEILGTLKRLAVDENFVHPQQTWELPLTPRPAKENQGLKTITILSGPRGVGKSAALYHAVHYARKHGWIVLFVPSARELTREAAYIKPSTHFKGFFDTPELSQSLLSQWHQAHGHQFSQIPISDSDVLKRYDLGGGATLADLSAVGLHNPKVASSVVVDLKTLVEKQRDYPVLVAIDEVDEWYHPSTYYYALRKIEADRVAVVKVLKDMIPAKPEDVGGHYDHVVVVAARTKKYPRIKKDKKAVKDVRPMPRLAWATYTVCGRRGMMASYELSVSNLALEEFDNMYKYMGEAGLWGPDFQPDAQTIALTRFKTGSNPNVLFKEGATIDGRMFAPQNRVGKASDFAPPDLMLHDLLSTPGTSPPRPQEKAAATSA